MKDIETIISRLKRGSVTLVDETELKRKLELGRPLIVKLGADPSAPDLHLGHAVVLNKLKDFQDLGHTIYFVIGDFTGRIGDPTGKSKTRPALTHEAVLANAETYKTQVFKILDPEKTKIVFNSSWSDVLTLTDVLKLSAKTTVAQLLERDDFMKRYKGGKPIALVEFFYPIMQAYDSVELKADVELGGNDQTFNLLFARDFQKEFSQEPQIVLTVPLLVGLDGHEKMSKSLGNYIGLTEPANQMYGKLMSIPDTLILSYFELLTTRSDEELTEMKTAMEAGTNPRDYKRVLAADVVTCFHDEASAAASAAEFKRIFQAKGVPDTMETLVPGKGEEIPTVLNVLRSTQLFKSNSEIRRLIKGRGVKLAEKPLLDETARLEFKEGDVLKVGKRHFFKLSLKENL